MCAGRAWARVQHQIWGALGLQVLNAELEGWIPSLLQAAQADAWRCLTNLDTKLFFLEPRVLRKVKNLIFLTGGRCNRLCTGGIMRFANTNIAKSFSFFNFKAQHLLLS